MSAPTLLLYAKQTGHVLAAATLTAAPSKDPTPEALAGDLLPVRHSGDPTTAVVADAVTVPADELEVLSVDAGAVPIAAARAFVVDLQTKTTQPLLFTSANTPTVAATSKTMLRLNLNSAAKALVWARIEPLGVLAGQVAPQTRTAKAPPGQFLPDPIDITINPLPSGQYGLLVLEPGMVPLLQTFNV
jgi:hypothetical protein